MEYLRTQISVQFADRLISSITNLIYISFAPARSSVAICYRNCRQFIGPFDDKKRLQAYKNTAHWVHLNLNCLNTRVFSWFHMVNNFYFRYLCLQEPWRYNQDQAQYLNDHRRNKMLSVLQPPKVGRNPLVLNTLNPKQTSLNHYDE